MLRKSSSWDVLEQAAVVIQKAHAQGSDAVELSLYEGAQHIIKEFDDKHSEKDSSATNVGTTSSPGTNLGSETNERFLSELVLALFGSDPQLSHTAHASNTESVRRARVKTASTLLQSPSASVTSRQRVQQVLQVWLEHEPSQPLRQLAREGLQAGVVD